jgi:hypothetical protein
LIPALGEMQLRLITRESVQSLLTSKRRSGLSWRTVKHIHTTFGTILAAAVMEGLIPDNPVRKTREDLNLRPPGPELWKEQL